MSEVIDPALFRETLGHYPTGVAVVTAVAADGRPAGMVVGTWMAYELQFKGTVYPVHLGPLTIPGYAALWALIVNLAVAIVASFALDAAHAPRGTDVTQPEDYGP